jgi:hypothetical protein
VNTQNVPTRVDSDGSPGSGLAGALTELRAAVAATRYPLALPSGAAAHRAAVGLVAQIDDYLLPRLARLDAPLLVVVGGSTGAGKSTLVNSLIQAPVSAAGVLRPTTRAPVLVCSRADLDWFRGGDLLPGLTRTAEAGHAPHTLQLVPVDALAPGLAFLDAPDIDSVVEANRALAEQLLAAADLWLFVTTAARYADAVPWELLRVARNRGTVTSLVLDRVPADAASEIAAHLTEMLAERGLGEAPLFVIAEGRVDDRGLLDPAAVAPLRDWFAALASDAARRSGVVRQTVDGALAALPPAVAELANAADEQAATAAALAERVVAAYRGARATVEDGVRDGRLLRGEVLARWQEFVGTGEFMRTLQARIGRLRDRITSAVAGRPQPGSTLQAALESQLAALIQAAAGDAADHTYTAWNAHPAGAALLTPALARSAPDLPERCERLVRDWQRGVLDLVREQARDKRALAKGAAYAVNATGVVVMIAVFASTAFIPTGLEVAAGAGTAVAGQKLLEAIFGDQAIRTLAAQARDDLLRRIDALFTIEAARYLDQLQGTSAAPQQAARLRSAAGAVDRARRESGLASGRGRPSPTAHTGRGQA